MKAGRRGRDRGRWIDAVREGGKEKEGEREGGRGSPADGLSQRTSSGISPEPPSSPPPPHPSPSPPSAHTAGAH